MYGSLLQRGNSAHMSCAERFEQTKLDQVVKYFIIFQHPKSVSQPTQERSVMSKLLGVLKILSIVGIIAILGLSKIRGVGQPSGSETFHNPTTEELLHARYDRFFNTSKEWDRVTCSGKSGGCCGSAPQSSSSSSCCSSSQKEISSCCSSSQQETSCCGKKEQTPSSSCCQSQ